MQFKTNLDKLQSDIEFRMAILRNTRKMIDKGFSGFLGQEDRLLKEIALLCQTYTLESKNIKKPKKTVKAVKITKRKKK